MANVAGYALAMTLLSAASLRGDGGTLIFAKRCDGYRVALFVSPSAPRAGVVDFSVLVQALDADTPLFDVPVAVHAYPANDPTRRVGGSATTAAATNKLFRAVALNLSEPGRWVVEVAAGSARVEAELEVAPPLPSWLDLSVWIGWPAAAVGLFAVHRYRVRRFRPRGLTHEC